MKQFAVIGLGRFGMSVARTLETLGHQVMGVDSDAARVKEIGRRGELTHVIASDCTEEESITNLGLMNNDGVVVAIGRDLQASILVTLMLREAREAAQPRRRRTDGEAGKAAADQDATPRIIAKAANALHGKVLTKVGADEVVYPERQMGYRVAHQLLAGSALDSIELGHDYRGVEVAAPPVTLHKSLREMNLRARYGLNVVGIRRGDRYLISPRPDEVILPDDILLVMGDASSLRRLAEMNGGGR